VFYQALMSSGFPAAEAHAHQGRRRRAWAEAEGSVWKLQRVAGGISGSCVTYQGNCDPSGSIF